MKKEKIQQIDDPDWIKVLAETFSDKDLAKLSKNQKRLLQETFYEKLNSGMEPREAIKEALEITLCFS